MEKYNFRTCIIIMFLLTFQLKGWAQDTIQINFDVDYKFVDSNGHSFLKLITIPQWDLQYNGEKYSIKFPENFVTKDSAMALEYFTGWKNPKINNQTALLIGNYTTATPIIYVDYNHNLDFSDDGQPVKFSTDSTAIIYLKNSENPAAYFPVFYYRYPLNEENRELIHQFWGGEGPNSLNKGMTDIDYWFATKRINYRTADTWINGKNIKIGLYDWDCNGLYNNKAEDRIMVGIYENNFISGRSEKGAIVYTDTTKIILGNTVYEIIEIGATGSYIKLRKSRQPYKKPISVGDTIPNFNITLLAGKQKIFFDIKDTNKFTLLDFWGSWCKGCTQQLPMLQKMAEKYKDELQIIGCNYGDDKETIKEYIRRYTVSWLQTFATDEIQRTLLIDGYPNYLLLDKDGKILLMNGGLAEIEQMLKP